MNERPGSIDIRHKGQLKSEVRKGQVEIFTRIIVQILLDMMGLHPEISNANGKYCKSKIRLIY